MSRSSSGGARVKPDGPDSWLQIRAPWEATGEGMPRRAVARALYAFQGRRDTLYRIRSPNEPLEIGQAPSGCIRMRDMDAIDLYGRVRVGAPAVVIG
jgi:lipoprotein-anchoring transpeptidase ErfK/SrfK